LWGFMILLCAWLLPSFGVSTGFNGTGGEGFGLFLLYAIIGGGSLAAEILYDPVFAEWKDIVLAMKEEEL